MATTISDLDWVVERMSWAKLTREYADWPLFRDKAEADQAACWNAGYIPDTPLGADAECLVEAWLPEAHRFDTPWLDGVSPAAWRESVERTRALAEDD